MSAHRRGRVAIEVRPHAINRPLLYVSADDTYVGIGLAYGNGSSDPVLLLDVDLTGTRAGHLVSRLYWRWDRRQGRSRAGG